MHDLIAEYIDKIQALGAIKCHITELYGALLIKEIRYSPGANIEEIQRLVEEAELRSESICQDCGAHGLEVEINKWVRTLCEKCVIKRKEKDKV